MDETTKFLIQVPSTTYLQIGSKEVRLYKMVGRLVVVGAGGWGQ